MADNGDNLSVQEKLILHQTKKMEQLLKQLLRQMEELTKAVTAGNVIDRLSHMASDRRPVQAMIEDADDWRHL